MRLRSGKHTTNFDGQLLMYLMKNNNVKVQQILQRKPSFLNFIDDQGSTLLHYAAQCYNKVMVNYLIDSKVNLDIQDSQGRTPLMIAALDDSLTSNFEAQIRILEYLLFANAKVHLRDNFGESALQMIFKRNMNDTNVQDLCVQSLILHHSYNNDEMIRLLHECNNPLHNLVYAGFVDLTRVFLQTGYPVDSKSREYGDTALHHAVKNGNLDHVKLLIEFGADVNAKSNTGNTPMTLLKLSEENTCAILKILMDHGALTTTLAKSGSMQMERILRWGNQEEIQLLLQYNIDFRATDMYQRTVVHCLAENQHDNIMELLEGKYFEVDAEDEEGQIPLHFAVGNSSSVNFLLKNGADVNAMDDEYITPLHRACSLGCDTQSIKFLLEHGANPQKVDISGNTAMEAVLQNGRLVQIKLMLVYLRMFVAKGVKIRKRIHQQISENAILKNYWEFCALELERMKKVKIYESITLYELLTKPEDKLIAYIRNEELAMKLSRMKIKNIKKSNIYFDVLRKRMSIIIRNAQIKNRAALIICKLMRSHYEAICNISDKIVNYLDKKDLLTLILL